MTLFRLWVSRDGYYIGEPQAVLMGCARADTIVRTYTTAWLSVWARQDDLSAAVPYYRRVFEFELFAAPDGPIAERFAAAIEAGASLLQPRKLQPCRYGEIPDHAWAYIDRGLETP